jgi:hypothetical protein
MLNEAAPSRRVVAAPKSTDSGPIEDILNPSLGGCHRIGGQVSYKPLSNDFMEITNPSAASVVNLRHSKVQMKGPITATSAKWK